MGATGDVRIAEALATLQSLGLDTSPVIYPIEVNPRYIAQVDEVFRLISRRAITGVPSMVTLAEVLVQPFQRSDTRMANEYRNVLLNSGTLRMVPVGSVIAERAAELRARYRLRMPDAL